MLISHRLVQGANEQLMVKEGIYAGMYQIQAQ